ncbi:MAG: tRNA uridine-5-carboxymethylaminomethyl(34) synthesis enzyme MnmG [Myxococcaceae bacterium]|nr:tRNA uridine-5-carboxymethylaminomethyl(34) synthesis enzyme MnmG [Myxococcaceae bacterium]
MDRADVIVVGLGHAGCEAALACARLGLDVVAVTLKAERIAVMSCNPAIGGTAKGHLVRELDALGGEMARAADLAGTHQVTLNASRGPAVRATRVLCDRDAYARAMQGALAAEPTLHVLEGEVAALLSEGGRVTGVALASGQQLAARAVVVTTGTFLQALMHVGAEQSVGGRLGDAAATGLSASLRALGLTLGRFKTGTPPRLRRDSIDWARCTPQPSEARRPFSLRTDAATLPAPTVTCAITHTSAATHAVLRENLHRSPLFQGAITGRGPRYCPSLEDKVVRFPEKGRHTLFLEPEGPNSPLVYPAGVSTSLPADVQLRFLRTIVGLEAVEVERFGYAVEYDFAPPTQLRPTLECKAVGGLFLAGQLNGTSGYEEAAFQGLLAGLNAGLQVRGAPPLVLGRHEAHGAVLLDELVTHGVDEPFRMFTSRSEHRLTLREGNAEWRLRAHGHRAGLVKAAEHQRTLARRARVDAALGWLSAARLESTLQRPGVRLHDLPGHPDLPGDLADEVETEVKYRGYVAMALASRDRLSRTEDAVALPEDMVWAEVPGLSAESRETLTRLGPRTVGDVRRLRGLDPAALELALLYALRPVSRGTPHGGKLGKTPRPPESSTNPES